MSGTVSQIDKLNEDNYSSWALQMKSVLITMDFWHVVENTCSSDDANEIAKWQKCDKKALAIIMLNVKTKLLIHIKECETAKDAWNKLSDIYRAKGPARKVFLFKQLMRYKFTSDRKYSDQLNDFCEIVDTIKATDLKVSDLLSVLLLSSLPDSFENFVVAIESRDKLPNFDQLKIKIIEEDQRRAENHEIEDSAQKVFAARFFKNNRYDHKMSNEGDKPKFTNANVQERQRKCYACGKMGHIRSQCRKRNHTVMLTAKNNNFNKTSWILDSGASSHMCNQRDYFVFLNSISQTVILASGDSVKATGIGNIKLNSVKDNKITLRNVLYVPDLKMNILSVSKILNAGLSVNFTNNQAEVKNRNGQIIFLANLSEDIFRIKLEKSNEKIGLTIEKNNEIELWHKRLGHLNYRDLNSMCTKEIVRGLKCTPKYNIKDCENCALSKIHSLPFEHFDTVRSSEKLQIIHTDICGPFRVKSEGGSSYFILFIDDFSRFMFVYFLKHKSEALNKFKMYKNLVEKQTGNKIKCLRSDNGREFINNDFDIFLKVNGIHRQTTTPYTPQQNGVAERANRTIMEMARCMLLENNIKKFLWSEAVNTAVYLRNRCPSKSLNFKSPYEFWFNIKPNIAHLRVFGSSAVVFNKKPGTCKLESKGVKTIFVGYSDHAKAYRLYNSDKRNIIISRDVKFIDEMNKYEDKIEEQNKNETKENFFLLSNNTISDDETDNAQENLEIFENKGTSEVEENEASNSSTRKPNKIGRPKILRTGKRGRPIKIRKSLSKNNVLNYVSLKSDPTTVNEAMKSENSEKWKLAMKKEYDSLIKNNTWELVDVDSTQLLVGNKWVFVTKYDAAGNIEKFKARLVAKGCQQKYNINYSQTFAPVARHSSIRLFLAMVSNENLFLNHIDIVSAYLNGELKEDVFMKQPEMFIDENQPNKVCKLKKSIYGLKQAGRDWNIKLNTILLNIGFYRCKSENCIYTKITGNNDKIYLLVYVDDILLACKDQIEIQKIIFELNKIVDVVDRGAANYFIGMEIERSQNTGHITIHQNKYTMDLLTQYNMNECKPASTPWASGTVLEKCDDTHCKDLCIKEYQSLIGSLMHLAVVSRPDIVHTVTKLSRFNTHPHQAHFTAAKHVLRYLKNYPKGMIKYDNFKQTLLSYADADWGSDELDRKSYSGFALFFGGGPISWVSKKQDIVSLSSTEAEYIALSQAAREVIFHKNIITELDISDDIEQPVTIYCDNQGAQFLATNPATKQRSKHIDIKYHYIKEKCETNEISITYVNTNENIADVFTKCLTKEKHEKFTNMMIEFT